ncbi:hypothetical protein HAX54_038677 [Datura stramonium]|uniref:Uncharacterized protein n=1 Tax=Datura stramonium TaxID=4076 RepID=A0ABS8VNJ3_DATST|nr:hypothetical protein [Datura stramonium]
MAKASSWSPSIPRLSENHPSLTRAPNAELLEIHKSGENFYANLFPWIVFVLDQKPKGEMIDEEMRLSFGILSSLR